MDQAKQVVSLREQNWSIFMVITNLFNAAHWGTTPTLKDGANQFVGCLAFLPLGQNCHNGNITARSLALPFSHYFSATEMLQDQYLL